MVDFSALPSQAPDCPTLDFGNWISLDSSSLGSSAGLARSFDLPSFLECGPSAQLLASCPWLASSDSTYCVVWSDWRG